MFYGLMDIEKRVDESQVIRTCTVSENVNGTEPIRDTPSPAPMETSPLAESIKA